MFNAGGAGRTKDEWKKARDAKVDELWNDIRKFKNILEKTRIQIIRINVEEKDELCDDIAYYLEIIDNLNPELTFDPCSLELTLEKIHDLVRRFPVPTNSGNLDNAPIEDDEEFEKRRKLEEAERIDKLFPKPTYTANIYNDIDERVTNNNDHERGRGLLGPSPSSPDPQFSFGPVTNSLPLPNIPPNQFPQYKQNNMNIFPTPQIIPPPISIPEIPQVPVQQQNLNNSRYFIEQQQQNSQFNNFYPPTGNLSIQHQPQFQQFSPPSNNNMFNTNSSVPNSNLANSFRGSQQPSYNSNSFQDQFQRRPTHNNNQNQNNSPNSWRNTNNNNRHNNNRNNSVSGNDNRNSSSYNSSTYNQHRSTSSSYHNHQQQHYKSNYNNKNNNYHHSQQNNRYPQNQNSGSVARNNEIQKQNPNNNNRYFNNPDQFPISPPLLPSPSVSSHPVLPSRDQLNNNSSNQTSQIRPSPSQIYNQEREMREIREKEIAKQIRINKEKEEAEIKRISQEKARNCFLNKSRSGPSNSKPNNVPPPRIASNQIPAIPKHPAPAIDDRPRIAHFKTNQPLIVQQKLREEAEKNQLNKGIPKKQSISSFTEEEKQEKLDRVRRKGVDRYNPAVKYIEVSVESENPKSASKVLQNGKDKKGRSSTEKEKEKRKNSDEEDDDGKSDNFQEEEGESVINVSNVKSSNRSRRRSSQSDSSKSQPNQISPNRVSISIDIDEVNKNKSSSSSSKSAESSKKVSKSQKSKDKSKTKNKSSTSSVSLKIPKKKTDGKSKIKEREKRSKIKKKKSQNSGKTPVVEIDDESISEDRDSDIIEIIRDNIQEPQVPMIIVEKDDEFGRESESEIPIPTVKKVPSKSSKFKSKTPNKINKKMNSKSLKKVMDKGKSISKTNKKGNKKNINGNKKNVKKNVKKTNLKKKVKNTNAPPVRITRASVAAKAAAKAREEQINNPITIDDEIEEPPQYLPSIVFDENFKVKEESMDQVDKKFDINSIEFDQNNLVNNDQEEDEEPSRIDQEETNINVASPLLEGSSNMMSENNLETEAEANTINERGDGNVLDECIINAEFSVGAFDENQEEVLKIKEEVMFEDEVYESNERRGRKRKISESSIEMVKCDYCSFTAENIVPHYVEMHPGRTNPQACLTPETIEAFVQNNVSNCFQLMEIQFKRTGLNKIWPCLWCSDTYDSLQEYYEHLSSHTGEYQYGCSICSCILPYKKSMKNHLKTTHKLKEITGEISQNMKKMYEPSYLESANELSAFMCGNCYYFQLQAENIGTHLNECKHSASDVYSIRFTIAPEDDDEYSGVIKKEKLDIKTELSDDNFNSSVFLGGKPIEPNNEDDDVQIIYQHNMIVPDNDVMHVDSNEGFISNLYDKLIKKESTDTPDNCNDNENNFISMVNVPSPVERNTEIIQLDCESTIQDLLSNLTGEENKLTQSETAPILPSDNLPIESPLSTYDETMNDYFEPDSDEESEDSEEDEEEESLPKNDIAVVAEPQDKICEESTNSNDQSANSIVNIVNDDDDIVKVKEEPVEFPETSLELEPIQKSPEDSEESSKIDDDEIKILDEVVVLDIQDLDNKRITNLRGYDLYKCGNEECNYKASLGSIFKDHISSCRFQTDGGKLFPCSHCERKIKTLPRFMEHLKVHGIQKQKCSLCNFRCWVNTELTKHFKSIHKVNNYKLIKSSGSDPDFYLYPKEVANKLLKPEVLKMNSFLYSSRIEYYPSEIELISHQSQIFPSTVHCALCSFETKVRCNLIRHLELHLRSDNDGGQTIVPTIGPVNPVPCLEKNEMMFDKMTNWAGSSHANKAPSLSGNDEKPLPEFVKEQFRYVCSVDECKQITVDDNMLRTHMRALHYEVDQYKCPHCLSKSNVLNQVPIEKLGNHLKFHGSKLFKCGYCDYLQTHIKFVEKHVAEKHYDKKPNHLVIRNLDDDGIPNEAPPISRRSSSDDTQKQNEERTSWRCAICKTFNSSWTDAKSHCQSAHKVNGQFMCSICQFTCDIVSEISTHVSGCSRGKERALIMVMFLRNDAVENGVSNEESSNLPLWRPNNISIKHIRGIYLEPEKRYTPTPINNQSKSSSSFSKLISSNNSASTSISPPAANNLSPTRPGSVMYSCPKCTRYKSKNSHDMTVHLYNELHYQRFACKMCHLRFVTLFSLKAHIDMDHKEEYAEEFHLNLLPFNREIEEAVTKEIDNQTKQLKNPSQWEKEPRPNDLNLSCKHCQHNFSSYHNYKTHLLAKHIASERYKCDYCQAGFWNPGLVKSHHIKSHVQDPPLPIKYSADEQLEKMLTPEFWKTEYGIPLSTTNNNNKTNASAPITTTTTSM